MPTLLDILSNATKTGLIQKSLPQQMPANPQQLQGLIQERQPVTNNPVHPGQLQQQGAPEMVQPGSPVTDNPVHPGQQQRLQEIMQRMQTLQKEVEDIKEQDPGALMGRDYINFTSAGDTSNLQFFPDSDDEEEEDEEEDKKKPNFKIPSGYRLKDEKDPAKGLEPVPGGPANKLSPGDASKIAMMEVAKTNLAKIAPKLFKPDGSIDRTNVFNADIPLIPGDQGTPWTEGRTMRQMFEYGIQALTRGETGAAMPPSEVENTRSRYFPNFWDSDEQIRLKWLNFQLVTQGTLDLIYKGKDGKGRFNTQKADKIEGEFKSYLDNRKKEWMKKAAELNPEASANEIHKMWERKLVADPSIIQNFKGGK